MKLFLISQTQHNDYDTYDSAVVAAPDAETAKGMDPASGRQKDAAVYACEKWGYAYSSWCRSKDDVVVKYLGEAVDGIEQVVVCASFNAG